MDQIPGCQHGSVAKWGHPPAPVRQLPNWPASLPAKRSVAAALGRVQCVQTGNFSFSRCEVWYHSRHGHPFLNGCRDIQKLIEPQNRVHVAWQFLDAHFGFLAPPSVRLPIHNPPHGKTEAHNEQSTNLRISGQSRPTRCQAAENRARRPLYGFFGVVRSAPRARQ